MDKIFGFSPHSLDNHADDPAANSSQMLHPETNAAPLAEPDIAAHHLGQQFATDQQDSGYLEVDVVVPQNREQLSDYEVKFQVVKAVLEEKGRITPSNAAVEEVVGNMRAKWAVEGDPLRQSVPLGRPTNLGRDVDGDGQKDRAYRIVVSPRTQSEILKWKDKAVEITQAGTRAVHEMTPEERWAEVKRIYSEKYAAESDRQAIEAITSPENLATMVLVEASMATPAGPYVAGALGAKLMVKDVPEAYAEAIEVKRLTLAPEKPSDLDLAAQKLAVLKTKGKILAGNMALGAAIRVGPRVTSNIKANVEATTPTGQAVVTEGGARLNMKMPVEQSGAPPGTFKGVPQEAVTGGLPGGTATGVVTSTRPTATENFGGPIGRPEPVEMALTPEQQARLGELRQKKGSYLDAQKQAEAERLFNEKLQKALAEGKFNDLKPAEQAWLNADPTGRRMRLAFDPDEGGFRVREVRGVIAAETQGVVNGPVQRAFNENRSSWGGDYIDANGRYWDFIEGLDDPVKSANDVFKKALPERPGAKGEDVVVDMLDLTPAQRHALKDEINSRPKPPGTGEIRYLEP